MRIFGKGKCKLIANCANFWQRKVYFSATMVTSLPSFSLSVCIPIVPIFGKGKCKFIANFSATMVTSVADPGFESRGDVEF